MPVEKSGQNEFDFEYGDDFAAHIERYDPDFSKVLVRYNPDGDAEITSVRRRACDRLADWLHEHERKLLFELLGARRRGSARRRRRRCTATTPSSAPADASRGRRPAGRRRRGRHLEDRGLDERADCERIAAQRRPGGRDGVACTSSGGSRRRKVEQWPRAAAPSMLRGSAIVAIWADPSRASSTGAFPQVVASQIPTTTSASSTSTPSAWSANRKRETT